MKKLMIILIAALSFNAASAQNRDNSYNSQDRYQVNQTNDRGYNNNQHQSTDYAYNNNRGRDDDRNRQGAYDRNQQYDQRINGYRNDRSLSRYERARRTNEVEHERQQKSGAFGKGLVVGGIAGVLLGVLIGH
jgi:hypothetical protein